MADATNVAVNGATEDTSCYAPADQGLLGLRLAGLFGILAVSTIGVIIPALTYKAKLDSVFFVLRAFAAGVVLTTGYVIRAGTCSRLLSHSHRFLSWYRFVHVLADAYPILTDPCLGLSSEYPWAMTIATAASLMAFTLEWVLHKTFHKRMNVLHTHNGELRQAGDPEPTRDISKLEAALPTTTPEQRMRLKTLHNAVISYTFEIGIIFHSKTALLAPTAV